MQNRGSKMVAIFRIMSSISFKICTGVFFCDWECESYILTWSKQDGGYSQRLPDFVENWYFGFWVADNKVFNDFWSPNHKYKMADKFRIYCSIWFKIYSGLFLKLNISYFRSDLKFKYT